LIRLTNKQRAYLTESACVSFNMDIFDDVGKRVFHHVNGSENDLDTGYDLALFPGMYLLHLKTGDSNLVHKFIVQ